MRQVPDRGVVPRAVVSDAEELPTGVRLQKFLATAGVDSRRNCEEYIRTGRVTVDSELVTDPACSVHPETQDIRLDGERLRLPKFKYFLLNKPKGVLCTNSDPQGRPRAVDLIPAQGSRLFTVGRLDESTQGLLLITNDGDLAERLAHPRFEVVRRYRCHVAGIPTPETLQQLRDGMYFSDGFFRFRGVRLLNKKGRSGILELELREGKYREIRRLMAKVGHKVLTLERIAFGPLRIGYLSPGRCRELHTSEVQELRRVLAELERNGGDRISERRPRPKPKQALETAAEADVKAAVPGHPARRPASGRPTKPAKGRNSAKSRDKGKSSDRKSKADIPNNKGRDRRRNRS